MAIKRTFKSKKVLSGVQTEYRGWKDWDEGDVLIGKLVGTQINRKNKSKKDWIVQVEDAQFSDKKAAKKLSGKKITLNTAGQLDKGMEQIEIGDLVQITYNGQAEMQGGEYEGQMAHNMEVIQVEEDSGEESEESEDDDSDDDSDDSDDESEEDEDSEDDEESDDDESEEDEDSEDDEESDDDESEEDEDSDDDSEDEESDEEDEKPAKKNSKKSPPAKKSAAKKPVKSGKRK